MALNITKIIEEKYKNYKLSQDKETAEEEVKNLAGMVAMLYATAGIDSITEIEEGIIKKIYTEIITKAQQLEIDINIINIAEQNVSAIVDKKNLSLSEALRYILAYKDYKKSDFLSKLEMSIEAIIKADGVLTKEEELFQERFTLFIKKGKSSLSEIEQAEENDVIPNNYYIQGVTSKLNFAQHPSTQIISPNDNNFKNINSLAPNKFYIIHPIDSNMLFSISDIAKINDFIIDEFRSLACALGAKKFTFEQSIISEESEDKSVFFSGKFSSTTGQNGEVNSNYKSETNNNSKNIIKKTAEFIGGEKESKDKVLNSLLWLKHSYSSKKLIEQVYSSNCPKLFEDYIDLESYLEENTNFDFDGSVKVAAINDSKIESKLKSKMNTMKKMKQHIILEF